MMRTATANVKLARDAELAHSRVRKRAKNSLRVIHAKVLIFSSFETILLSEFFFFFSTATLNTFSMMFVQGYRLRQTDNRINRTKHRQQPPSGNNKQQQQVENSLADTNALLVGNAAVAPLSLSMKELRRKGLTKYDAELLIAQGCRFSDIAQQPVNTKNNGDINQVRQQHTTSNITNTRNLRNKQQSTTRTESNNNNNKNSQSLRASRYATRFFINQFCC